MIQGPFTNPTVHLLEPYLILEDIEYIGTSVFDKPPLYDNIQFYSTDGSVWGFNRRPQLSSRSYYQKPFQLDWPYGKDDIAGWYHYFKEDNSLWLAGGCMYFDNLVPSLGIKNDETVTNDVKILDNVKDFYFGTQDVIRSGAITYNGELYVWGDCLYFGQYNREFYKESLAIRPDGFKERVTEVYYEPIKILENVSKLYKASSSYFYTTLDGSLIFCHDRRPQYIVSGTDYVKLVNGTGGTSKITSSVSSTVRIATPSAATVLVNGKSIAFDAYTIDGNNYFKLRDLAFTLSGTSKQFDVGWDGTNNAISLTSGKPYTSAGSEIDSKGSENKTPVQTSAKIYLDGVELQLTAYTIDGNNYFMLRDIGKAFDFGVDWDSANNTIVIDTAKSYI